MRTDTATVQKFQSTLHLRQVVMRATQHHIVHLGVLRLPVEFLQGLRTCLGVVDAHFTLWIAAKSFGPTRRFGRHAHQMKKLDATRT